jgi:hypothetical protein
MQLFLSLAAASERDREWQFDLFAVTSTLINDPSSNSSSLLCLEVLSLLSELVESSVSTVSDVWTGLHRVFGEIDLYRKHLWYKVPFLLFLRLQRERFLELARLPLGKRHLDDWLIKLNQCVFLMSIHSFLWIQPELPFVTTHPREKSWIDLKILNSVPSSLLGRNERDRALLWIRDAR